MPFTPHKYILTYLVVWYTLAIKCQIIYFYFTNNEHTVSIKCLKDLYIISIPKERRKTKEKICIIDRYFVDISKIESTKRFQMLKRKNYFFHSKKNSFCHTWTKNTHTFTHTYIIYIYSSKPSFILFHIRPISIYIRYQKSIMEKHCSFASESDCVWFLLTIAKSYRLYFLIIFYLSRKWIRCNGKTIWISPFDIV